MVIQREALKAMLMLCTIAFIFIAECALHYSCSMICNYRAWSFIVPAFVMMFIGIVMFLFLVVGESVTFNGGTD